MKSVRNMLIAEKGLRHLSFRFRVEDIDQFVALEGGVIHARLALAKNAKKIGDMDCLIAATAMRLGCPILTGNHRHFHLVEGMKVESIGEREV